MLRPPRLFLVAVLTLFAALPLMGNVRFVRPAIQLCVRPQGAAGCYSSIQAAVDAAAPHDTVLVYNGTYAEGVIVGKPITLTGQNATKTIIDAKRRSNGIFVDGLDNPGLTDVRVSGFTTMRAQFEGIVVVNATHVTIRDNIVMHNDLALDSRNAQCNGLPSWETDEHYDCGEGIHITGVSHSLVTNNRSERNSGGILISDDTGKTHDNIISNNIAHQNPFDCGIVLASHPPAPGSTAPHYGVFHNTVIGNDSSRNGYKQPGAGAGVGIFSDGTGPGVNSDNLIANNVLLNNGLPGIVMQSHADFDDMSGNQLVGNKIAGDGSLGAPSTAGIDIYSALGPSHMANTVVSGNVITHEQSDIEIDVMGKIRLHDNSLLGGAIGVLNFGHGLVDARNNWWGCPAGPGGGSGCTATQGPRIKVKPWLTKPPPP